MHLHQAPLLNHLGLLLVGLLEYLRRGDFRLRAIALQLLGLLVVLLARLLLRHMAFVAV